MIKKINVEQNIGHREFYLYSYPLDTQFKEVLKKNYNLHLAHVHTCANYKLTRNELRFNYNNEFIIN